MKFLRNNTPGFYDRLFHVVIFVKMNYSINFFDCSGSHCKFLKSFHHFVLSEVIRKLFTSLQLFILSLSLYFNLFPSIDFSFLIDLLFECSISIRHFPKTKVHFLSIYWKLWMHFIKNPFFLCFTYFSNYFEYLQHCLKLFPFLNSFHLCFSSNPTSSLHKCLECS